MRKVTFIVSIIVLQMLFLTQKVNAEYTIYNGSKHKVRFIVSTWMEGKGDIPTGYQTNGHHHIEPGDFYTIKRGSSDYYIRMTELIDGTNFLIRPRDAKTRNTYTFKIEPRKGFTVVQKGNGDFLYGSRNIQNLENVGDFYKYKNGGTFSINGDNLVVAKLKRVNSELKKKEETLEKIKGQLARLTSTVIPVESVGYTVLNGSEEKVYLVVSTWREGWGDIPTGYRTIGYYLIEPGNFYTIDWGSSDYYIRMHKSVNGTQHLIKPQTKTREHRRFLVEPQNRFMIVENNGGKILHSSDGIKNLDRIDGFYKYGNKGTFRIGVDGPHIELAEKKFKLSKVNRELEVMRDELAKHIEKSTGTISQEVHALLIFLGNDNGIRASVEQNESRLKGLLKQVSQHANVHLTVMTSKDELIGDVTTMKLSAGNTINPTSSPQGTIRGYQVTNWFYDLHSAQQDTILVYYNGHGKMRAIDGEQVLSFNQQPGDEILRSELRALLARQPGRLKMLITDTCSNRANTSALVAQSTVHFADVRPRSETDTKNLFFQHEGFLDITAVEPGHYAFGTRDIGGFFTVGLIQSFTAESDTNQDGFLTWEEVFKNTQDKTNELFKRASFLPSDERKMKGVRQRGQEPFKHSLPTPAK